MMETNVPSILVTKKLENVYLLLSIVMTTMLALKILAILQMDYVTMNPKFVTTTTLAQEILVMLRLENVSSKTFLLN